MCVCDELDTSTKLKSKVEWLVLSLWTSDFAEFGLRSQFEGCTRALEPWVPCLWDQEQACFRTATSRWVPCLCDQEQACCETVRARDKAKHRISKHKQPYRCLYQKSKRATNFKKKNMMTRLTIVANKRRIKRQSAEQNKQTHLGSRLMSTLYLISFMSSSGTWFPLASHVWITNSTGVLAPTVGFCVPSPSA